MSKQSWRDRVNKLNLEVYALYLAFRDKRCPWYAKVWIGLVVGYAVSPIDLIPDFIPVLGQIDDLIIIPAGIAVAVKMIPKGVMDECRQRAVNQPMNSKTKYLVIGIIVSIYALVFYLVAKAIFHFI
jgi:uncharacterized membrane protein YkvA (DUF1232 family)